MTDVELPELHFVRTALAAVTVREDQADDGDGLGLMDVRFSPFDTWYEVDSFWEGQFMERSVKGAFKRTVNAHNSSKDTHVVKTLFNHGTEFHEGDKLLGDIVELREDDDSPRSTVRLWDTTYNRDLLPGLRSGAYGSSFMFRVVKEEWYDEPEPSDHNPKGLPERTLKELRLFEAGPVTWPANPAATAGMRAVCHTDLFYERLALRDPERVDALRSHLTALRDSGRLAPGTRLRPALAPHDTPDPASRHSDGLAHAHKRRRYFDQQGAAHANA